MDSARTIQLTLSAGTEICAGIQLRDKHVLKVEMEGEVYEVIERGGTASRNTVVYKDRMGFLGALVFDDAEIMDYDRAVNVIIRTI